MRTMRTTFFVTVFIVGAAASTIPFVTKDAIAVAGANAMSPSSEAWQDLPTIRLRGGLKAFWRIADGTRGRSTDEAIRHGFLPLTELSPFADYPGGQKENIANFIGLNNANPWVKPPYFERIVQRNIAETGTTGVYVNDIEFVPERDARKVWANLEPNESPQDNSFEEFKAAYIKEWATWYWLPIEWTRERYPGTKVGLFGAQPFAKESWNIKDLNTSRIDSLHQYDLKLWEQIDPHVDFVALDTYFPHDDPGALYYIAEHLEQNYRRESALSGKPIYAYQWMRAGASDPRSAEELSDPEIIEAMAMLPFVSGAKAVVLWDWLPSSVITQPYRHLRSYIEGLSRISALSDQIVAAKVDFGNASLSLWREKRPLIRKMTVNADECIIFGVNPWQPHNASSSLTVSCGAYKFRTTMHGRHAELLYVRNRQVFAY